MAPLGVGVLLNPIAGFGGTLALHGTDRLPEGRFDEAVAAGRAERRLIRAVEGLGRPDAAAELLAPPGLLGGRALSTAGIAHRVLDAPVPSPRERTRRTDTIAAARALRDAGVCCIVFAGGDGTATDIAEAIGTDVPVIGVPSGVKMHSEVFARSPEAAGRLLSQFLHGSRESAIVEVLDVGPDDRTGVVAELRAPRAREPLQGAKSSARPQDGAAARRTIARELIAASGDATTWVLGPGTTTGALAAELGFAATLRGVDVRHPSGDIELDVDEARLYEIARDAAEPHLVLGVVGGQGFLLGRGNQEISTRVIGRIGADRVSIVAAEEKIGGLFPPVLLIDVDDDRRATGDGDRRPHPLEGYRRVCTGARQSSVMRVIDAAA